MRKTGLCRISGAVLATTAVALAAPAAWAQDAGAGKEASVNELVVTGKANTYVAQTSVSAAKTDTPLIETPQSVSVVGQDQITTLNMQNLTQALGYVAGATPAIYGDDPRFSWFNLRGFNETGYGEFLDGLKLFSADFIFPNIEPYGMDRLEILKGPSSVLYGQNAPGGLVNAVSKRPEAGAFGALELQVGNFARYEGRLDLNGPLTGDGSVLARVTGLYRDSGTQYARVPDDETFIAPALTWKPRDGTSLTLLANYQRNKSAIGDEYYAAYLLGGLPQTVYKGQRGYDEDVQESGAIGYQFDQRLTPAWSFHQAFRFNVTDVTYRYGTVLGLTAARGPTGLEYEIERQAIDIGDRMQAVTLDNNIVGSARTGPLDHRLLAGLDYQHSVYMGREYTGDIGALNYLDPVYPASIPMPTTLTAQTRQISDQVGVYGQDQIKLGPHWALTGSVRQDWSRLDTASPTAASLASAYNGAQDTGATTGRVGLVYLSDIGLAPYVSYSTSFLPQSGVSYSGRPFDPLTGRQYEAGVRYQPKSGVVSVTLSVYDLTENNVLSADPDPSHVGYNVETGQERSRGVELEGAAHPVPGLNLLASYTYDDVRITQTTVASQLNRQPLDTPADQASGWADYTVQSGLLKGFGLGGGVRYIGRSYVTSDDLQINPGRTFVDAMVHYDVGHWRMAINATNLADLRTGVCDNSVCRFSQARTVIGSLKRTF